MNYNRYNKTNLTDSRDRKKWSDTFLDGSTDILILCIRGFESLGKDCFFSKIDRLHLDRKCVHSVPGNSYRSPNSLPGRSTSKTSLYHDRGSDVNDFWTFSAVHSNINLSVTPHEQSKIQAT